jgi:hypothetical protein
LPLSCSALKIFYHRKSARLCAAKGSANVKAKLENAPAFSRRKALYTWVERFNVQARPGATTIIKEINPLLLKACALDPTS